jgi:hypothetical protein
MTPLPALLSALRMIKRASRVDQVDRQRDTAPRQQPSGSARAGAAAVRPP